jgi:hypothetical protein
MSTSRDTGKPAPKACRSESPLVWLRRRKDKSGVPLIREELYQAGERLGLDFRMAEMMPRTTMSWSGLPIGGGARTTPDLDVRERALLARERVRRALSAVGPEFAGILIDVCCFEMGLEQLERRAGWPDRSGKIVVQYALSALARHYGYLDPRPAADAATARIRHWGADDYRPHIDSKV